MKFKNFPEVIEFNAKEYPKKIFCIEYSTGRKISYSEFDANINQCCHFLQNRSVAKGDIVSICIKNSYAFMVIYFAVLRLNAAINPLPSSLSYQEIKKSLKSIPSKMIFSDERNRDKDFDFINQVFFMDGNHSNFFEQLSKYPPHYGYSADEEIVACYYYSSGTMNNPKCIMYTHKNMISLIDSMNRSFHFGFNDVHLGILPLGHTAITNYSMLPAIYNASTLIICNSFMKIRADFWRIVNENLVTYVEVVPTVLLMMLYTPYNQAEINANNSLKYIGCGSAPLTVDIQKKFQERFGLPVANLYGLSETGPTHFDDPFQKDWQPGSIGRPIDVCQSTILREDKSEADIGEIGEIAIKGENVFVGYYNNEKAYNEVMYNGYFLTGDMGYKDSKEIFHFVDRKKDMIIKGGVNILPGEIEEVLYQMDGIEIAAVIGVPDIILGEEAVTFVKLREGASIGKRDIQAHIAQNFHDFKHPKEIYIVTDIPLGPSGKILKRELRSRYNEGYYGKR